MFALLCLVMTRNLRSHIEERWFADNDSLAVITVAFARLYFDAYD